MVEQTAVLVPVMRRTQAARPFMDSFRAATALASVYAVADATDTQTIMAWVAAGATVLVYDDQAGSGTFAQKVNHGYRCTTEPWLFLAGDDVRFHHGWLAQALSKATRGVHVIGTNDLGNAAVMAGEHATHMLIRREYVDQVGASWDGPGVVCHEGYRHWWVDNEVVTAAKQRRAWAMALDSVVEHLHPLWGKGEVDDTYLAGQRHAAQDAALFAQRRARYAR